MSSEHAVGLACLEVDVARARVISSSSSSLLPVQLLWFSSWRLLVWYVQPPPEGLGVSVYLAEQARLGFLKLASSTSLGLCTYLEEQAHFECSEHSLPYHSPVIFLSSSQAL